MQFPEAPLRCGAFRRSCSRVGETVVWERPVPIHKTDVRRKRSEDPFSLNIKSRAERALIVSEFENHDRRIRWTLSVAAVEVPLPLFNTNGIRRSLARRPRSTTGPTNE